MIGEIKKEPLNLRLLKVTNADLKSMVPVTAPDIFERGTHMFHPDGLYSTEIFGQVGSYMRSNMFSYIDLKNEILHPLVLECLNDLKKNLYLGIAAGSVRAIWDNEEKDFVKNSSDEASTGFEFFMQHWKDINHKLTGSDERAVKIDLLNKYLEDAEMRYHLIMPAGYRDMEIRDNGQRLDNEINDLYRRLLAASNVMIETQDRAPYDVPRWTAQRTARDIFDMIIRMLKGKSGTMQKKYGRRTTRNSTRNVVTAMDISTNYLDSPTNLTLKDTQISFYQALFGALPYTLRGLKLGPLEEVFPMGMDGDSAWLVNPDTLKRELVDLDSDVVDYYATTEGRKKLLKRFFNKKNQSKPLMVDNYYMALIYEDDETFKVVYDIDDVPEGFDRANVTPMTIPDLLYISTYQQYQDRYGTLTRYPITEDGSTFPTRYQVTSTVKNYKKYQLNDNWEREEELVYHNFPDRKKGAIWLNSLSPHLSRLEGSGGDFDGDQYTSPFVIMKDSEDAIRQYYLERKAYVRLDGTFLASAGNKSNGLVAFNLTRDAIFTRHEEEQDFEYFNE